MTLIVAMSPIIIMSSFMFTRLLHPLTMGIMLLAQTTMICVTAGLSMNSFWFSYILFLIFLGAMLVLFIYVASLASNEPFSFSFSLYSGLLLTFLLTLVILISWDSLCLNFSIKIESSTYTEPMYYQLTPLLLSTIYNNTSMNLTLFVVLYLLLTLIAVVKITDTFFGPLRLST
uniref:NADH-ubiquinone oxidoreductase chain 6 n=1 Tax=Sergia lucens TaxID=589641 RepID=A0A348AW13_9EUCA|nr:NADH dehydrogenase subunit 6 [Sergia lucens]BBC69449.1 NADH dehydrogenase subunit 6 [Sergia lucens]